MNNVQCHVVKIHLCSSSNEQNVIVNSYHSTSTLALGNLSSLLLLDHFVNLSSRLKLRLQVLYRSAGSTVMRWQLR